MANHFYYFHLTISIFSICLISSPCLINSQQPYIRKSITPCEVSDNSTSNLGYIYNGITPTCQSYLTFRSRPPFNSVSSISNLLAANPTQLSQLNSVAGNAMFPHDKMVLVPVNCSRVGSYYQSNISYVIKSGDGYFSLANNTLEGLSTCQALQVQNNVSATNLEVGMRINVPLRCGCPTKTQSDAGVKYLLSYLTVFGQTIDSISNQVGVDNGKILEANELSQQDQGIYPFTTLLIPLQNPPSSSQTVEPPPTSPPPPPPSPVPSSGKGSSKTWVYVVAGILGGLAVLGVIVFFVFFRKNKKKFDPVLVSESFEAQEKPDEKRLEEESEFFDSVSTIAQSLKVYSFKELEAATENFSPSCLIKGSVYRGVINGDLAAIKIFNGDVSKEINALSKFNHFNLIRLSGVCFNDGNWYLVYEYAVNGALSDWIYKNDSDQKFLTWTQRIQIALDVSTGLNYLHTYSFPSYVHKDIKSSTVLLDGDCRAKIVNFDSARSADGEGGEYVLTRHIAGTKGYMAPEYLENGMISPKLDVYSFGILMLEMLTGKGVSSLYEGVSTNLRDVLIPIFDEEDGKENLANFMDPSLQGNYPVELAVFMVGLIDSCIKNDPSARPDMDEIVQSLSRTLNTSLSWELSISISA